MCLKLGTHLSDFGSSASQMFTLHFEKIKPKRKTLVKGIMFHFLSPETDNLVENLFGVFFVAWCVRHETVAHKRCFESSILVEVILLLKKGTNDITSEKFDV